MLLDSADGNLSFFTLIKSLDILLSLHLIGFDTCGQRASLQLVFIPLGSKLRAEHLASRQLNLTASHLSLLHGFFGTFDHLRSLKSEPFALHILIKRARVSDSLL